MSWQLHPLQQVLGGSIASPSPDLSLLTLPHDLSPFLTLLCLAYTLLFTLLFFSYRTLVITQTLPQSPGNPHFPCSYLITSSKSLLWKTMITRSFVDQVHYHTDVPGMGQIASMILCLAFLCVNSRRKKSLPDLTNTDLPFQGTQLCSSFTPKLIRAIVFASVLAVVVKYPDASKSGEIGFILAYSPRGIQRILEEKTRQRGGKEWLGEYWPESANQARQMGAYPLLDTTMSWVREWNHSSQIAVLRGSSLCCGLGCLVTTSITSVMVT